MTESSAHVGSCMATCRPCAAQAQETYELETPDKIAKAQGYKDAGVEAFKAARNARACKLWNRAVRSPALISPEGGGGGRGSVASETLLQTDGCNSAQCRSLRYGLDACAGWHMFTGRSCSPDCDRKPWAGWLNPEPYILNPSAADEAAGARHAVRTGGQAARAGHQAQLQPQPGCCRAAPSAVPPGSGSLQQGV